MRRANIGQRPGGSGQPQLDWLNDAVRELEEASHVPTPGDHTLAPFGAVTVRGTFALENEITPAQLTGNVNNYDPADATDTDNIFGAANVVRLSSDASRTITGLLAPTLYRSQNVWLTNVGAEDVVLANASGSSDAANRFDIGSDFTLGAGQSAMVWYDPVATRWRIQGSGASITAAERTKLGYITVTQAVDLDAIETRVNALDAAVVLQGTWDASSGSFPGSGTAQAGDSWIVSVGGTVDSVVFVAGDRIIAITDNASTSTFAANWFKADYTDVFQTDAEIETAYNNQVAAASQAEMEAGTETAIRRVTPQRVAQAIAALAPGGAWEYIGAVTAAGGTVDFTDLDTTYAAYLFVLTDIDFSTDAAFEALTDANNGASFDTGASDYSYVRSIAGVGDVADSSDNSIVMVGAIGGASGELQNGYVWLYNPAGTGNTALTWMFNATATDGATTYAVFGAGRRLSAAAVNAIRFQTSTGNISAGTVRMYGLVPS